MSDSINNFKGPNGWDASSSQNAGQWQAQQGQQSAPQQPGESAAAYQNRQAAYEGSKRTN
jgi:hypothetical protein